jgi:hypothetical protein
VDKNAFRLLAGLDHLNESDVQRNVRIFIESLQKMPVSELFPALEYDLYEARRKRSKKKSVDVPDHGWEAHQAYLARPHHAVMYTKDAQAALDLVQADPSIVREWSKFENDLSRDPLNPGYRMRIHGSNTYEKSVPIAGRGANRGGRVLYAYWGPEYPVVILEFLRWDDAHGFSPARVGSWQREADKILKKLTVMRERFAKKRGGYSPGSY